MTFQLYSWKTGPRLLWGIMSKHRRLANGVPQGPGLLHLFSASLHIACRYPYIQQSKYTHTRTNFWNQYAKIQKSEHLRVDEAAIQLHDYLRRLEEWLTTNRMSAEGLKSSLMVVIPHNMEHRFKSTITLLGQIIPVNNDKNIFGVTIDRG